MECVLLNAASYLDGESDINVHQYTVGSDARMHTHDFNEIAYISGGRGVHCIGGERFLVQKGDFVILNAFVPHQFISGAAAPLVIYNCVFLPPALHQDLGESGNFIHVAFRYLFHTLHDASAPKDFIKISGIRPAEVEPILREMQNERAKQQDGYRQVLQSDLTRLLIFIFRLYRQDAGQVQTPSAYKQLVVENALAYIHDHCDREIRVDELAGRAYISGGYFSRIFKEVTGKSVIRAVQEIRMERAAALLKDTNYPVAEIAANAGYNDLKYFYTLFAQHFGMTPGEFRSHSRPLTI